MTDEKDKTPEAVVDIERLGGLAGFGGPGAKIRSHGTIALSDLSAADRARLEALVTEESPAAPMPDEFLYRITRQTEAGSVTIDVPESRVPQALRACVRDELM
ncbi:protealysin inhibitor emfourin [Frigidibacter sp. SD6-1]|uniref:protealysin inhibitor emfourin n=1 Tax=Frigidibacter sp. SD6-1 TaxID=3032581 RepID=UPI0024DFE8CF|nr:protealysin inhibitor emfourin [Frigidibacter sp. SD6-1]